jgi:trehalose 6-phosphate synthase/phosphatase
VDEVKQALTLALNMEATERNARFLRNMEFSTRLTTTSWAVHVLHDLKAVEKAGDESATLTVGFGIGYKVMGFRAGFAATDVSSVSKAYKLAHHRLILLDWGGTLVQENEKTDKLQAYAVAKGFSRRLGPTAAVSETLEKLCSDPKNIVFVISGKELVAVSEFWGEIKNLGLGAEHGFFYRWPRDEHSGDYGGFGDFFIRSDEWKSIAAVGDQSWKQSAKMVMDIFVQRTHGTYLEEKGNALIWQFRDADPEFGFLQSKELEEHLKDVLSGQEVEVLRGGGVSDGYIEVRPTGMSKGLFLEHALGVLKGLNKNVDFVLAIGDDSSDEPMFEQISALGASGLGGRPEEAGPALFGLTVGKKPSAAGSYLDDPSAVLDLLNSLTKVMQRAFFSTVNLPGGIMTGSSDLPSPPLAGTSAFGPGAAFSRAMSDGNLSRGTTAPEKVSSSLSLSPQFSLSFLFWAIPCLTSSPPFNPTSPVHPTSPRTTGISPLLCQDDWPY